MTRLGMSLSDEQIWLALSVSATAESSRHAKCDYGTTGDGCQNLGDLIQIEDHDRRERTARTEAGC